MQTYLKTATGATCPATDIAENSDIEGNPIFPNPSFGEFTFQFNANEKSQISIYESTGKKVEEFNSSSTVIHFGKEYAKGIYFIMYTNGVEVKSFKIVKV